MPSIPGNGVEPPAASSSSLKTESSPSGPLDLRGDAKSPRRCSRKPLLTLDMRWQRMRRGTAARSKDIEVASQGQSERAAAATASACVTGSAQLENSPILAPRVLAPRARLLFAAVARHGDRWLVSLNVEAPEFHAERRHRASPVSRGRGFVGIDRGIAAFVVAATADGLEVARFHAPRPLARRLSRIQRRAQAVSRAKRGSRNRVKAVRQLAREHARIANIRQNFLHRVSSPLAKTHSQLAIEDLATANLIRNKHLSRAIADAGWGEFARQLTYKADWFGGELVTCDRWFASTKICSACGTTKKELALAERTFRCNSCGLIMDRDSNAAANLAAWADAAVLAPAQAPDRQAGGRVTNASGGGTRAASSSPADLTPEEGGTDAPATAGAKDTREG
jgi:putative transposase